MCGAKGVAVKVGRESVGAQLMTSMWLCRRMGEVMGMIDVW